MSVWLADTLLPIGLSFVDLQAASGRSGSGRVVAVLAYLFRIPPVAGPSQKGGRGVSLISYRDDENYFEVQHVRRNQFARLVAFQVAVSEYQKSATHQENIDSSTLPSICDFLNALLAVRAMVSEGDSLEFGAWSEYALAAFHEVAIVVEELIDDLSLRTSIETFANNVVRETRRQVEEVDDRLGKERREYQPEKGEVVVAFEGDDEDEEHFGFGNILLTSATPWIHLPPERPFVQTVEFHPLDDDKFGRVVRSLATIGWELSEAILSRRILRDKTSTTKNASMSDSERLVNIPKGGRGFNKDKLLKVLRIIRQNPRIKLATLAEMMKDEMTQSTLENNYLPILRDHFGITNDDGRSGYYDPATINNDGSREVARPNAT